MSEALLGHLTLSSYYLLLSLKSILHLLWSSVIQAFYNRRMNIHLKSGVKPSLLLEVSLDSQQPSKGAVSKVSPSKVSIAACINSLANPEGLKHNLDSLDPLQMRLGTGDPIAENVPVLAP